MALTSRISSIHSTCSFSSPAPVSEWDRAIHSKSAGIVPGVDSDVVGDSRDFNVAGAGGRGADDDDAQSTQEITSASRRENDAIKLTKWGIDSKWASVSDNV